MFNHSEMYRNFWKSVAAVALVGLSLAGCATSSSVEPTRVSVLAAIEDEPIIVDDERNPGWDAFADTRVTLLRRLAEPLLACTEYASTPHDSGDYPCTVKDWPSQVRSAYGLARIARRTNDPELARRAVAALSPRVLAEVASSLRSHGVADDPHAYVSVLIADGQHRANDALHALAIEVAGELEAWLGELDEDEIVAGVLVGRRDSVAWIAQNLWQWAADSGQPDTADRIRAFTDTRLATAEFDQFCDPTIDGEPTHDELFPPCLHRVNAVLTVVPGDKTSWLARLMDKQRHLDPLEDAQLATHAALNFSRSSSLWALYRATGERSFQQAYVQHIQVQMRSKRWGEIQQADRAWVAQFGVQAIEDSFADDPA